MSPRIIHSLINILGYACSYKWPKVTSSKPTLTSSIIFLIWKNKNKNLNFYFYSNDISKAKVTHFFIFSTSSIIVFQNLIISVPNKIICGNKNHQRTSTYQDSKVTGPFPKDLITTLANTM